MKRDRNHPSIIIWSICNEKLCAGSTQQAQEIKDVFHSNDPLMGRPVSANNNGWNGANTVLDLQGFDYNTGNYDDWHKRAPNIPAISSETSSAVSDRGEYANDKESGHVRGYDTEHPGWAQTAEYAWSSIDDRDFMSGGFTWTGFDYKGEPTPYGWPNVNSHFGTIDIAGFPKDRFYWYQANYVDKPLVHVFPHWNWATSKHGSGSHLHECTGMCSENSESGATVEVWAFSNADVVELFVNGVSQGNVTSSKESHFAWPSVPYSPGKLQARGYMHDGVVATMTVVTTGVAAKIRASIKDGVGSNGIVADNSDAALVQVEVLDKDGNVVPANGPNVTFSVGGPGKLTCTSNGDPSNLVNDKSPKLAAYHGLLLGVVQGTHEAGKITVTASTDELGSSTVILESKKPTTERLRLTETSVLEV